MIFHLTTSVSVSLSVAYNHVFIKLPFSDVLYMSFLVERRGSMVWSFVELILSLEGMRQTILGS